jgi:hypothetical protein
MRKALCDLKSAWQHWYATTQKVTTVVKPQAAVIKELPGSSSIGQQALASSRRPDVIF